MRKSLLFLLGLQFFFSVNYSINAVDTIRVETLIRRVYLDVIGVIPTPEEIDWYIVYNKNGYELAVKYVLQQERSNTCFNKYSFEYLCSQEYKTKPFKPLSKAELDKCIVYIAGDFITDKITKQEVETSLSKIINHSSNESFDVLNRIDYICNLLMSRNTNIQEANNLLQNFKTYNEQYIEDTVWLLIVADILQLHDVCNK